MIGQVISMKMILILFMFLKREDYIVVGQNDWIIIYYYQMELLSYVVAILD